MSRTLVRSANVRERVQRATWRFRRRLMSRSDVKRAQRVCRSQNRQLMRGDRA